MSFSAQDVKALRESTGAGMMDCKKALEETGGDMDDAKKFLREKGLAASAKRDDRDNNQGVVAIKVDGGVGVMVLLKSETDFVAGSDQFKAEADALVDLVLAKGADYCKSEGIALDDHMAAIRDGGGRFGDPVTGARVLDLFAGTGALGLEALSRGAAFASFVENGRAGGNLLSANISKAGVASETEVIRSDATRLPPCKGLPCTLVFLDPPYGKRVGEKALESALKSGWIAADALVVWEEERAQDAPPGFEVLEARRYGQTWLTLLICKIA